MANGTTFTEDKSTPETHKWGNGSDNGGLNGTSKRVVGTKDKIRAKDINEMRNRLELLIGHTHDFEYSSGGGGGTTTCG